MGLFSKLFGGNKSSSGPPAEQMPFLKNMWAQSEQVRNQLQQQLQQQNPSQIAQGLAGMGMGNIAGLSNAGAGMAPFAQQGYGGQQMAGLQSMLNNNLFTNMLPQIRDSAQMAGGFGGSGMGLAQGTAMGETNRTLFEGAGSIMQQDLMRQQQAAGQQGQLSLAGNLGALGGLTDMYSLGVNAPLSSLFAPLSMQGGVMQGYNTTSQKGSGGLIPALSGMTSFNFQR